MPLLSFPPLCGGVPALPLWWCTAAITTVVVVVVVSPLSSQLPLLWWYPLQLHGSGGGVGALAALTVIMVAPAHHMGVLVVPCHGWWAGVLTVLIVVVFVVPSTHCHPPC